jgi:DNA-binding GntR family transcriptional regulator
MLSSIDIRTLRQQTYKAIKDQILKNELLPGHNITIRKLAADLGISETPVREALVMLKAEGFVDYEPHKKPQIANITEEEVRQVYEVRKMIEPYAAGLVIEALSKTPQLKEMLQKVDELVKKVIQTPADAFDHDKYVEVDLKLNELFLQVTENKLFREVFALVSSRSMRIRTFVEATSKARPNHMMHAITQEHRAIIQAMLQEDVDEAQKRVRQHLSNAELRTVQEMMRYKGDPRNL